MTASHEETTVEQVSHQFAQAELFAGIAQEALDQLAARASIFDGAPGDALFSEGDAGDFLVLILRGSVSLFNGVDGQEGYVTLLGTGETVGEISLLNGDTRSASAMVVQEATLARVERDHLLYWRQSSPETMERLMANALRLTSTRLHLANRRFHKLAQLGEQARRRVEQMRSQILSLVSHELRTPLTVIKSSAQVLRRTKAASGDQRRGFLEKIESQSEHLRIIVDDLISLSMLVAQPCLTNSRRFDVAECLKEVFSESRTQAASKHVELDLLVHGDGFEIHGDPELFPRAVRHLLSNAIKFSPSGARVTVALDRQDDGSVQLSVRDEGPGLTGTMDDLSRPFYQAEDPLVRENDGLGIGLSLAKQVARAHGGDLTVENHPDGGAYVLWQLPQRPLAKLVEPSGKEREA